MSNVDEAICVGRAEPPGLASVEVANEVASCCDHKGRPGGGAAASVASETGYE